MSPALSDHHFCNLIYFFDTSGHRMEMTTRTEMAGDLDRFARAAPAILCRLGRSQETG
jgi:hypothetical protein